MMLKSLPWIGLIIAIIAIIAILFVPTVVSADTCPDVDNLSALTTIPEITNLTEYHSQTIVPSSELATTCDQHALLAELFGKVTRNATTETQKVEMWVTYLQNVTYYSCYPPLDAEGIMVTSPLWLLKNRNMQCGQIARLAVDGFNAGGMNARVIQLNSHVAGEVVADGRWRYFDADAMGIGEFIRNPNGEIASVEDILNNRSLTAGIVLYPRISRQPSCYKGSSGTTSGKNSASSAFTYTSVFDPHQYSITIPNPHKSMLDLREYVNDSITTPCVIEKTAMPAQESNRFYGWNYYAFSPLVYPSAQQPSAKVTVSNVTQISEHLKGWSHSRH
jgi:hypothetical protein